MLSRSDVFQHTINFPHDQHDQVRMSSSSPLNVGVRVNYSSLSIPSFQYHTDEELAHVTCRALSGEDKALRFRDWCSEFLSATACRQNSINAEKHAWLASHTQTSLRMGLSCPESPSPLMVPASLLFLFFFEEAPEVCVSDFSSSRRRLLYLDSAF